MIFTLAYVPFVLIIYHYYGAMVAGLSLAGVGIIFGIILWTLHHSFNKLLFPFIAVVLGLLAYFSEDFIALKLYPLITSLFFLLYFITAVATKRYPIIAWVEKFKKRALSEKERKDVIVSHGFWIGVLALNTLIHFVLVFNYDTALWAFYSFAGWYIYFAIAMLLQLSFAHRDFIFQWSRNVWGYGLFCGVIIIGFIPAVSGYLFNLVTKQSKPHIFFQRVTAAMFRLFFRLAPGIRSINVYKHADYNRKCHYIYVASHESWLDYPLMGAYLTDLYHLTNKKNAFIWIIRPIAKLLGVIDGVGLNPLHELLQKLRNKSNVLIFPEGSRESEGKLLPFKKGAFSLAIESGVPIVPVMISGTRYLVPKGSIHWQDSQDVTINIQFLEPLLPNKDEDAEALKMRVWDMMDAAKNINLKGEFLL